MTISKSFLSWITSSADEEFLFLIKRLVQCRFVSARWEPEVVPAGVTLLNMHHHKCFSVMNSLPYDLLLCHSQEYIWDLQAWLEDINKIAREYTHMTKGMVMQMNLMRTRYGYGNLLNVKDSLISQ